MNKKLCAPAFPVDDWSDSPSAAEHFFTRLCTHFFFCIGLCRGVLKSMRFWCEPLELKWEGAAVRHLQQISGQLLQQSRWRGRQSLRGLCVWDRRWQTQWRPVQMWSAVPREGRVQLTGWSSPDKRRKVHSLAENRTGFEDGESAIRSFMLRKRFAIRADCQNSCLESLVVPKVFTYDFLGGWDFTLPLFGLNISCFPGCRLLSNMAEFR